MTSASSRQGRSFRSSASRCMGALLGDPVRRAAVFQLVDVSVPWQDSDLEMLDWLLSAEVPFALVYTKADRTKRGPLAAKTQELMKILPWREDAAILATSAKENEGIVGVRKWVEAALAQNSAGGIQA